MPPPRSPLRHLPPAARGGEDRWFPFCSERCKWVDLGRWLGEAYRISAPTTAGEDAPVVRQEEKDREAEEQEG